MYKSMDIAQYVINYSIDNNHPVSNLKLQKLLYYIQAAFLIKKGEPCFEEDIEHWRHGPVVRNVYSEYKIYMDDVINDKQTSYFDVYLNSNMKYVVKEVKYDENNFDDEDKTLTSKVIDSYKDILPWELVDKTHHEDPWLSTDTNEKITNESILRYFSTCPERIYGDINEN